MKSSALHHPEGYPVSQPSVPQRGIADLSQFAKSRVAE
jgi:hypothetical protein